MGDPRRYQASDFADFFGTVLSTGLIHTDDIPGMVVSVQAGTLNTVISTGKAIMDGYPYENTTPRTLTHSIPEPTIDRIDRIVLRLDSRNSERNILLHVKEGAPTANPVAPVLQRDNFIYEISLAQIRVRKNTVQLLPSDLIDERLNEDLCGLVYSLISIPTSKFQQQWDEFMTGIVDSGFASAEEFTKHSADDVRHITDAERIIWTAKVDESLFLEKTDFHFNKMASKTEYGHVMIGKSLGIENGVVDIETVAVVSDYLVAGVITERYINQGTPTRAREAKVNIKGIVRIKFEMSGSSQSGFSYVQIYVNGIAVGTRRSSSSITFVKFVEDISIEAGDLVQLYTHTASAASGKLKNFEICFSAIIVPDSSMVNINL